MANPTGLHEAPESVREETIDRHRALASMMEELEAVDWYDQRVDAATDDELKEILAHNRDEEKEHFVMLLEWIRRRDPKFEAELSARLFHSGKIAQDEPGPTEATHQGGAEDGSLGIGSLK